jgi:hypothetical protein
MKDQMQTLYSEPLKAQTCILKGDMEMVQLDEILAEADTQLYKDHTWAFQDMHMLAVVEEHDAEV